MFRRPTLTRDEFVKLKDIWLQRWNERFSDEDANHNASLWFSSVMDLLFHRGDDVVQAALVKEERALQAAGLEQDYVDALITVTGASPNKLMELVTATSWQRAKAVEIVKAHLASRTNEDQ